MSEGDFSLIDLFRDEVRSHTATLGQGLLDLEATPGDARKIEPLMRAAHSVKGAARIVGLDAVVGLSHVLEDALVAAQGGRILLGAGDIDTMLRAGDLLAELGEASEPVMQSWGQRHRTELDGLEETLRRLARGERAVEVAPTPPAAPVATVAPAEAPRPAKVVPSEVIADDDPMFELFRSELRTGAQSLGDGLDAFLRANDPASLESPIRAAQAIRGAARIVGLEGPASFVGVIEGILSTARQGRTTLDAGGIDLLRSGTTLVAELVAVPSGEAGNWVKEHEEVLRTLRGQLETLAARPPVSQLPVPATPPTATPVVVTPVSRPVAPVEEAVPQLPAPVAPPATAQPPAPRESAEAVVRVTAQSLNRLMSLAGESLVQARWLQPFSMALLKLKKHQDQLAALLDNLAPEASDQSLHADLLEETRRQSALCRQVLAERMREFEVHAAQAEDLNTRLYREVIVSRMRPFADGAHGFPRLVRDMARSLGKQVRLEIEGLTTEVDRDILEKLEAPLTHLLRNAIDHGIELPEVRRAAGKPEQGTIRMEVRHRAGMLAITIADDGCGVDLDRLRRKVVDRNLTTPDLATTMSEGELLEFLFLPGFSTARALSEYSGRGVGLDVVEDTIRKVGGSRRISTRLGRGTTFHLQLPITLSVLRAVLVDIAGEPYAFPHNRIDRLLRMPRSAVQSLEHRQYVLVDGENVGLVLGVQMLELAVSETIGSDDLCIVLMSDETGSYGLIVDAFRGEQDLVVRPLDPRLGKVPNLSAAAILDDGSPVLIVDVEDLIRAMDQYIQTGTLRRCDEGKPVEHRRKRVLVVDDSITVREVERQLLRHAGYEVEVAVDGKDGLGQAQQGAFDLVVTDIDMPRMTGLELVAAIRNDERLRDLPIVVVSYKDREEDRKRGIEVGANAYLTKGSFHDDRFLQVVVDLIGKA